MLDLILASLRDVALALREGKVTSVELVEEYLANIERDNTQGRELRAVIQVVPRDQCLRIAQVRDAERKEFGRGWLHGVPILLQDNIGTDPSFGLETTAGSFALVGSKLRANATVVDGLLNAGAIIIGKSNMTYLSRYCGSAIPPSWSPRGGLGKSTIGPHVNPSGSAFGNAWGLRAGFCAGAIGVETNGGVANPCTRAGLYGIKPTSDRIPNKGVLWGSEKWDTICPMGKTPWDVAAILQEIVLPRQNFVQDLKADLSNFRFGVLRVVAPDCSVEDSTPEECQEAKFVYEAALETLANEVRLLDIHQVDGVREILGVNGPWSVVKLVEIYRALEKHLQSIDECEIKSVKDLIEWNNAHPELAFYRPGEPNQQDTLEAALATQGVEDEKYLSALQELETTRKNIETSMQMHDVDILIMPAGLTLDSPCVAHCGGFPLAAVPTGHQLKTGRDCGFHLLALRGQEAKLIGAMAAMETLFKAD